MQPSIRPSLESAVVYEGPSQLTGKPIVAILTGIDTPSSNPKTGDKTRQLAQLWILCADTTPLIAISEGSDRTICGDCGHRGGDGAVRSCYVVVANAPSVIYRQYMKDAYPVMTPAAVNRHLRRIGRDVRLGAYGDPAALPVKVIRQLTKGLRRTGYTHTPSKSLKAVVMASVDSPMEARRMQSAGWRTFRTRTADQPLMDGEITCPASDEAGHRTTCAKCLLCDGRTSSTDRRRNITIIVHGATTKAAVRFLRSRAEAEGAR